MPFQSPYGLDFNYRLSDAWRMGLGGRYESLRFRLDDLRNMDLDAIALMYVTELMGALKRRVTRQRHANVLQHMAGYLKRSIDSGDIQELGQQVDAYRRGEVPLIVPKTLFRHYFRRHPDPYMERQVYLHPHPDELSLHSLDESLRSAGSRLVIRRGVSIDVLRRLSLETGATQLYWNRLYEPMHIKRDRGLKMALRADGLAVESHNGSLLFEPWQATKADGAPYFRVFNPVLQGQKFDPAGTYVRKWIPEIAKLSNKFLHQPWTAPPKTLAAARIDLGKTYPVPIADLKATRVRELDGFAQIQGPRRTSS